MGRRAQCVPIFSMERASLNMINLHCHSIYSMNDAISTPKDLTMAARRNCQKGVALTDHGVMTGVIKLHQWCTGEGLKPFQRNADFYPIKPIIGSELYVTTSPLLQSYKKKGNKNLAQDTGHMVVLVQNEKGYENLVKLSTISFEPHVFKGRPKVDIRDLIEPQEGLILLTGCMFGYFNIWLLRHHYLQRADKFNQRKRIDRKSTR